MRRGLFDEFEVDLALLEGGCEGHSTETTADDEDFHVQTARVLYNTRAAPTHAAWRRPACR